MKYILRTAALGFSLIATTAAFAGQGFVTINLNLRAGPDTSYPEVATVYGGTPVAIEGCVDGWSWCDVAYGESRGWVPANYLQQEYQGQRVLVPEYGVRIGIPVISFVFGSYWDNYYRDRSWYGNREHWSHVRPQYQPVLVQGDAYRQSGQASYGTSRGDSRTLRANTQRTVDETRRSRVVTSQPSYRGSRSANTAASSSTVTTQVHSPARNAKYTRPAEHRSVESRAVVQQQSRTTEVRSQQNHASHVQQEQRTTVESRPASKPATEHKAAQPRVIAERKAAPPKSRKDNPAKSTGKDTEQH